MANNKEIRKIEGLPVSIWAEHNGRITSEQSAMVKRRHAQQRMWDELSIEEQTRRIDAERRRYDGEEC